MYLVTIGVPFLPVGPREACVNTDWAESLRLLRDSFNGRFGKIMVAAPEFAHDHAWSEQTPERIKVGEDILFASLGSCEWRLRSYWLRDHRVRHTCDRLVRQATVVHAGVNDVFRPLGLRGFEAAVRRGVYRVWVEDTDMVQQNQQLMSGQSWTRRLQARARNRVYHRVMVRAVAQADLALLKGESLMRKYARYGRNVREIMDTSIRNAWIVDAGTIDERLTGGGGMLRCVSVGRLVDRKGVADSISAVHAARSVGLDVRLDIIGSGPERQALETQVGQRGLAAAVRLLGSRQYGRALIAEMAGYDAFLFTPQCEDTPRSLFDAMAAGLPLLAYDIPYTRQLLTSYRCGLLARFLDPTDLSRQMGRLVRDRELNSTLSRASRLAATANTAESWYERRAEWTIESWNEKEHRPGLLMGAGRRSRTSDAMPSADRSTAGTLPCHSPGTAEACR